MAKAELKTKLNDASVADFFNTVKDEQKRKDCMAIAAIMKEATKAEPKMWGGAIVGFGSAVLKYPSGRELDWFVMGFSPRKANLSLYIPGATAATELLRKLGKYKTGKGCLYINSLEDVDAKVLKQIVKNGAAGTRAQSKK